MPDPHTRPARPIPSPDELKARREVLRVLGASALGLPLSACGTGWGSVSLPGLGGSPSVEAQIPRAGLPGSVPTDPAQLDPVPPAELAAAQQRRSRVVQPAGPQRILPRRIRPGGTIGLAAPAGVLRSRGQLQEAISDVESLGFRTKTGRHVLARFGFLAGTDAQRAEDLMRLFADPDVDAILAVRGGWGCARILPLLDYEVIRQNPKPLIGYSDITALLLAIYAKTGLVTFHGPVGVSTWQGETVRSFLRVLVDGLPLRIGPETRSNRMATRTIRGGVAEGPLAGGNLSVIAGMAGSEYLPDLADHVLFFEEVGEEAYRLDRLLTGLALTGMFDDPAAVVFGQCSSCGSSSGRSAEVVIREHLERIASPSWLGAQIGHVSPVHTLPIGLPVQADANAGTLEFSPAVQRG
ncbi:MAG: LD-carboxypeptidase [Bacteroidota bacterium]